jgi:hypothetical protein
MLFQYVSTSGLAWRGDDARARAGELYRVVALFVLLYMSRLAPACSQAALVAVGPVLREPAKRAETNVT